MFGIGGGEFLVIALVALIAVGPEQLPSVMRKFGNYVAQLRSLADGVRGEFMSGMDELDPVKWTGDGSDEKPIVPRGYAESASKSTIDQAFGPRGASAAAKAEAEAAPDTEAAEETVAEAALPLEPDTDPDIESSHAEQDPPAS
ncbi:MAG: hypothetical protein R2733_23555 [Acidimicrobiales bacterium]